MRQQWLILGIVAVLISGCTTTDNNRTSSLPPVPTREVLGAEPQYEPHYPSANRDYQRDGQTYHIVQDPAHFTQTGYASWFGEESNGKLTAIGERANPYALAAAHPTLPIPSYVRVTNLSNGRMMIVRINDRGPYNKPGKIIELSHAAAERLNLMPQSKVKLDGILVSPDGSLSGLGIEGSTIVKQSFALPERPNLSAQSSMLPAVTSNSADENTVKQPLAEASESTSGYMVQVGAISAEQKAKEWQQSLSQRFNVQGRIIPFGNVYRVQLGPFNNRQQAMELQKKLTDQMQQSSFIVAP
ncbi:endolytic peptidoglycan transglycosylase RlpA [Xenorhabdus sp. BG5]|uniref:endolytic peptidoglycan transglycosylase RlpA n=1 Tax=Xenorhabdus sp. BG5 TaxID=2782014 RepID=UPI001881A337|nr:endolytic peptidoglycan transglycosylase RlpA [Xenorhabdus sp. BG5]MBE8595515.1 endolytic peptidoglycan transglycosylase RlpA [Xenorhabdus sp. BG5]